MDTPFVRLRERIEELGKHHRRFLVFVARHLRNLVERLEQDGALDRVPLWSLSSSLAEDFRIVSAAGRDEREALDFMACHYALQFLQSNVIAMDRLALDLAAPGRYRQAYHGLIRFQDQAAHRLHGGYMAALADHFLAGVEPRPEFAVCVVGTRYDQDDLDLLVVHRTDDGLPDFRRALIRTVNEMMKHAIQPHLYISERLGLEAYSASLREYGERIGRDTQDYVLTSELLSARLLCGSPELFRDFQTAMVDRYFQRTGLGLRFHEGYLRGLLGDIQSLLVRELHRDRLHFKTDALRLAKNVLFAGRVIHGIRVADPFRTCQALREKVPRRAEEYQTLEAGMVMVEVFRHLYQLISVQEEMVQVGAGAEDEILDQVATAMGFTTRGGVRPREQLLVHYYASVNDIRAVAGRLLADLTRYLRASSVFTSSFSDDDDADVTFGGDAPGQNLARELAEAMRMFGGQAFWDDVIEELERNEHHLARRLVRDIERLPLEHRETALENFTRFGADGEPVTLIAFLLTLREDGGEAGNRVFRDLVGRFFARTRRGTEFVEGFCRLFQTRPRLINRFIQALEKDQREELETLLENEPIDPSVAEVLGQIRRYIRLRTAGSEFYRRIFRRVINAHPEFIHHIGDVPRLQRFASGFLTPPEEGATFEERRRPLADYYDLRYLSCAISALHGEDPLVYRPRFVEFVDTFIRTLYAVVLREEMSAASAPPVTRDLFAVFATGGYAREQAFDDDYDLLPVLNTTDPDIEALVNRAWQRVHREIVRRGTIPQYRFADHFGGFVTRLEVLEDFFRSGASDTVDEAQVLGLRLVAGSSRMTTAIAGRVVRPLVFPRADRFISRIAEDMRERHALAGPADQGVDIKDGIGGLRDVEQILLVLNIRYQVMEPVTPRLYEMLAVVAEGHADELSVLARRHRFLREVRDLYRLTVAASDEILREHLAPVDAILRARGLELPDGPDGLFDVLLDSMEQVRAACRAILQDLGCGSCP